MTRTDEHEREPLMTVDELAAYLNVSKRAVYAMVARDQVPGLVRVGRRMRFEPRTIRAWTKSCRLRQTLHD